MEIGRARTCLVGPRRSLASVSNSSLSIGQNFTLSATIRNRGDDSENHDIIPAKAGMISAWPMTGRTNVIPAKAGMISAWPMTGRTNVIPAKAGMISAWPMTGRTNVISAEAGIQ